MLIVVVAFLAASVVLPTAEGALIDRTNDLPLGLSTIRVLVNVGVILGALMLTFLVCCLIYWAVPKGHMPWRAVWPGALFVTIAIGLANWLFPFYLTNASSLSSFGAGLGFALIALVWFYAISLALLAGAVINSLRHEKHDTGALPYVNETQ
jgi:membrane protein